MIVIDTCVIIFDALAPEKLSSTAKKAIQKAEDKNQLCCSDISLWEIAMLIYKKRLDTGTDAKNFLDLIFRAREIQVLSINSEIAVLSTTLFSVKHFDPADRIIAATAKYHDASIVTSDKKIQQMDDLSIIW